MEAIQALFGTEKPIIALLHLRALPGDPGYAGPMEAVVETARRELLALQEGGVDGILFSNEFSFPYLDHLSPVTPAAMAYVIGRLKADLRLPFGVHAISDPLTTIELAAAVEARFVRSVFAGGYVGEAGIRSKNAGLYARRKAELGLRDLQMYYMINAESDGDMSRRSLDVIARATAFKCQPDGICLSGLHAGEEADSALFRQIREAVPGMPLFSNTGTRQENVREKLQACDGAFVGTAFKRDGKFENTVAYERVRDFMAVVRQCRAGR